MSFIRVVFILGLLLVQAAADPRPAPTKRYFTVADDIGLIRFGDPDYGEVDPIAFSLDGQYFAVNTTRGRLDINRPESTLRVYRTEDAQLLLLHPSNGRELLPIWSLTRSTYKDGPIITKTRWLADSSGIAFLTKTKTGNNQLFLADLRTRKVNTLTPAGVHVTGFDIRDRNHVVYSALSPLIFARAAKEKQAPKAVATGSSLHDLLFPESRLRHWYDLSELWALVNNRRFRVINKASGKAIPLHPDPEGQFSELALSPDGLSVVTTLAVESIPPEWQTLYPPEFPTHPWRIRAGRQDLMAFSGSTYVKEYVVIDVLSGRVRALTNAPEGLFAGWTLSQAAVAWSADGRSVVLPNTFLSRTSVAKENQQDRPCVAVVELVGRRTSCVVYVSRREGVNEGSGPSWRFITNVKFASGSRDRVVVDYSAPNATGEVSYLRSASESWSEELATTDLRMSMRRFDVSVHQGLSDPPVLVVTDRVSKVSRTIWDPNRQLSSIDLGEASVIKWKDEHGRNWSGGLYKPPAFIPDHRYPLVIQTHGFFESQFVPSGLMSTAFAARELAASGIMVLQVKDPDQGCNGTSEEASCYVSGFEAGVRELIAAGSVDPDRVGIVGFSRSCYHVLEMLTTSNLHVQAASITDGVNFGYFQYLMGADEFGNTIAHEADTINGAPPFGSGLQRWLKSSPEFQMDKVTTPLQIVGISLESALSQWEPYAILRYLDRPVDLIVLGEGTHILTNPAQRMMSQGGTVDWFRFWLKGEEDPNPAKSSQYMRWRQMRARMVKSSTAPGL